MPTWQAGIWSGLLGAAGGLVWNVAYAAIYDIRRLAHYGLAAAQDSLFARMGDNPVLPMLDFWSNAPSMTQLPHGALQNFFVTTAAGATAVTLALTGATAIALLRTRKSDLYGSARLMEKSELAKSGLKARSGLQLGRSGRTIVRDNEQSHVLVIGPPESGKTECFVIPNLIEWEGSFIAVDFKGTLYERTARIRRKRGDKVYLLAPGFEDSNTYNPLDMIRGGIARVTDIQALASLLMPVLDAREAHWNESAQMLLSGMISYVLESAECASARTLGTVVRLFSVRDNFIETLKAMRDEKGISDFTKSRLTEFMAVPSEEAGSIRSTLNRHLKPWQNPAIEWLTVSGKHAIDIEQLRRRRCAIYLIIDTGQIDIFAPILKLFIEQVNSFINRAYRHAGEQKVLFMIDEFYQLGRIKSIVKQLPFARDRDIRICLVSQGVAQIDEIFTHSGREAIMASCALQLFCSFNDEATVKHVVQKVGSATRDFETTSRQMEPFGGLPRKTRTEHLVGRPLYRTDELYSWNRNHLLVLKNNANPFVCDKILADKTRSYVRLAKAAAGIRLVVPKLVPPLPFRPSWAAKAAKAPIAAAAPAAPPQPAGAQQPPSPEDIGAVLVQEQPAADGDPVVDDFDATAALAEINAAIDSVTSMEAAIQASPAVEDAEYTMSLIGELREEAGTLDDLLRSFAR